MGEQNHWERQRREIDAYNIFYSAFHGVEGGRTLKELGFRHPLRFPEIPIRNRQNPAEPDIVVYNDETLLLVEIKAGTNVTPRHRKQMERCEAVSIEDGEEFLKDAQIGEYGLDHTNLENIEPAIVYLEQPYQAEMTPNADELLSDIANVAVVMTQSKGDQLQIRRGAFEESTLNSFLSSGLPLPDVPSPTIYLNEEVEKECLAVSICFDHVLKDLKDGHVSLSPSQVEDLYPNRAIEIDDVIDVLDFLDECGACEKDDNTYVFKQRHQEQIFSVKELVSQQRVDDYMEHRQRSLEDY